MTDDTTTGETPADEMPADEMPAETYRPLRATTEAAGEVGGESHDSYGLFAVEGQRLSARLSWDQSEEFADNAAGFSLSEGEETFTEDSPVFTSSTAERESTTSGIVPRTGVYHISVTAHPSATYRLSVTLE